MYNIFKYIVTLFHLAFCTLLLTGVYSTLMNAGLHARLNAGQDQLKCVFIQSNARLQHLFLRDR